MSPSRDASDLNLLEVEISILSKGACLISVFRMFFFACSDPTQLRQFQECGGWIRVKLHTRLYIRAIPPTPPHTKKHHNVTKKSPVFFRRICIAASHELPVTCSSRSGWRRMQKKWSKWPVRPTIEFQISRLVYTGRAMETPSWFFNKWWLCPSKHGGLVMGVMTFLLEKSDVQKYWRLFRS